jgi:hypothetical protein
MSPFLRNRIPMDDGTRIFEPGPHGPPIIETYSQGQQHLPLAAWHQPTGWSNSLRHVNVNVATGNLIHIHIAYFWAARFSTATLPAYKNKYAPGIMSRFGEKPERCGNVLCG